MKDHVSFGSQPQYLPHAWSAQIAPAMTPKVQTGKPNKMLRYDNRSRTTGPGKYRRTPLDGDGRPAARRRSLRSARRYNVVTTAPKMNRPIAMIIAVTWIAIQ